MPEFHIAPDPAKLRVTGVSISDLLNAVDRSNIIQSPGLFARNHQLYLGLISGQAHDIQQTRQHLREELARRHADLRAATSRTVRPALEPQLHHRHRQRQARRADQRQPPARQQHHAGGHGGESGDAADRKNAAAGRAREHFLRPVVDRGRIDQERARRHPDRADSGVGGAGAVPAGLGHVVHRRHGDSRSACWSPSS